MPTVHSMSFRLHLAFLLLAALPAITSARQPNVIVIFTDDHGYADLSCQDIRSDIRTPNIDRLAEQGVRMTSGYVTAPQCVPSRAGLLSGRYQNRFGVESNGESLVGFNEQVTLPERLQRTGYVTGMIGKWHLGPAQEIVRHGFDDVFYQGGSWTNFDIDGNDVSPGTTFKQLYHLDAKSAAAKAFINRHSDEAFFLYLAYRAPHVPLDATQKYLSRFPGEMPERRRQALAMMSAVDDGVGGILDTLAEHGLEKQTLIFFIGDNGAPLKIHKIDAPGGGPGWDGSLNEPLNGEKGMLSEGGIRVPFVVHWPGTIPAGGIDDRPVISLDVAATAIAVAGLDRDQELDGVNLIPFLNGSNQSSPHEELYWRWVAQSAIRRGNWKYLRGGDREYLFNLDVDDEELHNVAKQNPEVASQLRAKLEDWTATLSPPGLATRPMSSTWSSYFDHYLDGKPIARPQPNDRRATSVKGWIARNGQLERRGNVLRVVPDKRNAPFIACSKLKLPSESTTVIRFRSTTTGRGGIAWRERGQNDFPAGQAVRFDVENTSSQQIYRVPIPASAPIIHLRLLLPNGVSEIASITVENKDGEVMQDWTFDGSPLE